MVKINYQWSRSTDRIGSRSRSGRSMGRIQFRFRLGQQVHSLGRFMVLGRFRLTHLALVWVTWFGLTELVWVQGWVLVGLTIGLRFWVVSTAHYHTIATTDLRFSNPFNDAVTSSVRLSNKWRGTNTTTPRSVAKQRSKWWRGNERTTRGNPIGSTLFSYELWTMRGVWKVGCAHGMTTSPKVVAVWCTDDGWGRFELDRKCKGERRWEDIWLKEDEMGDERLLTD